MTRKPAYVDTQNFGLDELFFADELVMTKPFPVHRHSFCELHLFFKGHGTEIINGIPYQITEGTMSLKMPWQTHEILPDEQLPLHISKCSFRLSLLETGGLMERISAPLAQNYSRCPVAKLSQEETLQAKNDIKEIMEEQRSFRPLKNEIMASLTSHLLILFLRKAEERQQQEKTANDILRIMNLCYRDSSFTCAKAAETVHYSESQAARLLDDAFGMTFGELMREIRIRNACELLKATELPIESIASASGYSSRAGFYAAFLEDRGITPAEYRKRTDSTMSGERLQVLSSSLIYAKLIYYLHCHYNEDVALEIAAERFHYSSDYIQRILKEQGTSFSKLLEEIRIYHARRLLLETNLPQDAVSRESGFASPETFYRAFRRQIGCSPAEYRHDGMKEN